MAIPALGRWYSDRNGGRMRRRRVASGARIGFGHEGGGRDDSVLLMIAVRGLYGLAPDRGTRRGRVRGGGER